MLFIESSKGSGWSDRSQPIACIRRGNQSCYLEGLNYVMGGDERAEQTASATPMIKKKKKEKQKENMATSNNEVYHLGNSVCCY